MAIHFNAETGEFSGDFRGWNREVVNNHELFGKKLGFHRVYQWHNPNSSYQELTVGIKCSENSKNGLVMAHLVGWDYVPRMQMLNADATNSKEVESTLRTMISGLLYALDNVPEDEEEE